MENLPSDTRPFSATFTYGPGYEVRHRPSCMVDMFVCRHTPFLGLKCVYMQTHLLECICLPTHPVGYTFFWSVHVCVDMLSTRGLCGCLQTHPLLERTCMDTHSHMQCTFLWQMHNIPLFQSKSIHVGWVQLVDWTLGFTQTAFLSISALQCQDTLYSGMIWDCDPQM